MTPLAVLLALTLGRPPAGDGFQPLPWHLADVYRCLDRDRPFDDLQVPFRVRVPVGFTGRVLFAPVGGWINGRSVYVALCFGRFPYLDEAGARRWLDGPMIVASLWGPADPARLRPADGTFRFWGDHEGEHVSLRRRVRLADGWSTLRLRRCDFPLPDGGTADGLAVAMRVDGQTDWADIGRFRLDGRPVLRREFGSFLEIYGVDERPGDRRVELPAARFEVGATTVDGAEPELEEVSVDYPRDVPQVARVTAEATARRGGAHAFHAGAEVIDRRGLILLNNTTQPGPHTWIHRERLVPLRPAGGPDRSR